MSKEEEALIRFVNSVTEAVMTLDRRLLEIEEVLRKQVALDQTITDAIKDLTDLLLEGGVRDGDRKA